jgi:hypothetical protein
MCLAKKDVSSKFPLVVVTAVERQFAGSNPAANNVL